MKKTILVFVLAVFWSLSIYSQKSNIGGGLEYNYLIGGVNISLRGEFPITKKDYIVMKGSAPFLMLSYSLSLGYQRMIFLNDKLPMWVGINITRDLFLQRTIILSEVMDDVNVAGIEIPIGIQYNFSSGIAPYVEVGFGTFFQEVRVLDRITRGDPFRMKVGVKYSFIKN